MRPISSILSRLVVTGMMVFNSAAAVLAQDRTETRREWGLLANGRTEFEVSDPALVPSTLAVAAEQSGCRYKDYIKEYPARFIRPEGRRLAIMFCAAIVGSHQVFDVIASQYCSGGVGKKSAFARFSASFNFRLLQHYPR